MKITAIFLGIVGLLYLTYLPKAFHLADNPRWLSDVFISINGILLLLVSLGIWTRRIFAWHLGFVFLVLSSVSALVHVCQTLPAISTDKKAIIGIVGSVFWVLVCAFWSFVWYHQKRWFFNKGVNP